MEKEVKKQIGAIRVSNPVGLIPRKIWNVLLVNAYDGLLDNGEFKISIKTLSDAIGFNSKNTNSLKDSLQKLQITLVEWDIGGQSENKGGSFKGFGSVQMLGGWELENGIITYRYDSKLKEILYNPIIYQKISISQQKVFSTAYGLYLWENCLRYIGVGSTGFSTVEEWRKLLGATTKSYDVFKAFKVSVLTPAIKEVNGLTNIHITLKTQKTGRRITHIGFDVVENKQEKFFVSDGLDDIKNSVEYKKLKDYKIEEIKAITLVQEYGYKYISEKIKLTEEQESIKNPSGFLLNSIEKDWKSSGQELKKSLVDQDKEKKKAEREQKLKDKKEAEIKSKKKEEKRKEVEEYLKIIDDDTLQELNKEFIEQHKATLYIGKHLKNGEIDLSKSVVKINYYTFIYKKIKR